MSGRGKSQKTLALVNAAAAILEQIQPASVRAVCYRLFVDGVIDSMSRANTSRVSRNLVWAREQGIIPWGHIVDETREAECVSTWDNPEGVISAAVHQYRKDYWTDQPRRVEVWSEKGTIRGTLAPVLDQFGVTFRVMHGYTSATAIQAVAQETADNDKPLTVLYVGDLDPSGMHMSEVDLPARLKRYGGTATIRRVALDAGDRDLPSFQAETKAADPRHKWFLENYGRKCWELDALPPPELRRRVEEHILACLDNDRWEHARMVEKAETESMQHLLAAYQGIISGQVQKYPGGAQ